MQASNNADHVSEVPARIYVDNHSNVVNERVGKKVGHAAPFVAVGSIEDVLTKQRDDNPSEDNMASGDKVEGAADVYAKEIEECERSDHKAYPLKTNVGVLSAGIKDKCISSRDVTLHRPIGEGGFVSLGSLFGEIVVVREHHATLHVESFKREMRAALRLSHPNIVSFVGLCSEPEKLLVVTEYMEMSLREALHVRKVQMGDAVKLDLMEQMWRGLDYLHKQDVAHCDIRSDNCLLQNVGEGERGIIVKLTDFGNAVLEMPGEEGMLRVPECSSPSYSAPEFLHEMPLSFAGMKAADVYSMAVTCFELSTEQPPFSSYPADQEDYLLNARRQDVWDSFRPSDCVPLKFGKHRCLEKCWDRHPGKRPTAEDVVRELDRLVRTGDTIFSTN